MMRGCWFGSCVAFSAKSGNTEAVARRFPVFRLRISVYPDILYRRTLRILIRQFVIWSVFATRRTGTDALRRFRPGKWSGCCARKRSTRCRRHRSELSDTKLCWTTDACCAIFSPRRTHTCRPGRTLSSSRKFGPTCAPYLPDGCSMYVVSYVQCLK